MAEILDETLVTLADGMPLSYTLQSVGFMYQCFPPRETGTRYILHETRAALLPQSVGYGTAQHLTTTQHAVKA
jgi:hypothetical protein